jgi:hypothetical protein
MKRGKGERGKGKGGKKLSFGNCTDFSRDLENLASIPLSCKERGFEFSPFPTREGGWGVRFRVCFST